MRLVVDIPDRDYNDIMTNNGYSPAQLADIIKNGIPLPKGHGRIIEESKITACEWDGQQMTTNAPTIIAADMEGKE